MNDHALVVPAADDDLVIDGPAVGVVADANGLVNGIQVHASVDRVANVFMVTIARPMVPSIVTTVVPPFVPVAPAAPIVEPVAAAAVATAEMESPACAATCFGRSTHAPETDDQSCDE